MFVENAPTLTVEGIDSLALTPGISTNFTIQESGFQYDGYFGSYSGDILFVSLHGAVDRAKLSLPVLARWNYGPVLRGSVLCLADPTLRLHSGLRIGWYIGTETHDVAENIARLVARVATQLGYPLERVVFFSGSAGGFANIAIGARLPCARIVSINPQTNLSRSHFSHMGDFLPLFRPGIEIGEALEKYPLRFSAIESFKYALAKGHDVRIIYAQNTRDTGHYKNHYLPFMGATAAPIEGGPSADGGVLSILFDGPGGHEGTPTTLIKDLAVRVRTHLCPETTTLEAARNHLVAKHRLLAAEAEIRALKSSLDQNRVALLSQKKRFKASLATARATARRRREKLRASLTYQAGRIMVEGGRRPFTKGLLIPFSFVLLYWRTARAKKLRTSE